MSILRCETRSHVDNEPITDTHKLSSVGVTSSEDLRFRLPVQGGMISHSGQITAMAVRVTGH